MLSLRLWLMAHPALVKLFKLVALLSIVIYGYSIIPVQTKTTLGINGPSQLADYCTSYARYRYQAEQSQAHAQPSSTYYGFIRGVQKDSLTVEYAENGIFVIAKWSLGNIKVTKAVDPVFLKSYQVSSFKFDVYDYDENQHAVIAYDQDGSIFNLSLIEHGYGVPIENPKTKVIDYVFSQFYLKKIKELLNV